LSTASFALVQAKGLTLAESTSCVPWEKFSLAMFMPFSIILEIISISLEAGPEAINAT